MTDAIAATSLPAAPQGAPAPATVHDGHEFGHDLLEVLNPLQHIPIVGMIYRAMTHDAIEPVERVVGDAIYGGLAGVASAVGELLFQKVTGKDVGETLAALFTGGDKSEAPAVAAATPPEPARVEAAYRRASQLGAPELSPIW